MAEQIIEDGAVVTTESGERLVCTGVTYQEDAEGNRHSYSYHFRSKADLDAEAKAEREAEEKRLADEEAARQINEGLTPSENSPEGSEQKTTPENSLPVN